MTTVRAVGSRLDADKTSLSCASFFSRVSARAPSFFSNNRFLKLLFCWTSWIAFTNFLYNSSLSSWVCYIKKSCVSYTIITLALLNLDMPCLCKQCRSRSVGFFRSQLIWSALFAIQYLNSYQQLGSSNLTGWKWCGCSIFIQHDKG